MPPNLKLKKSNFVRSEGYFYHLDVAGDTLYKKTDDGTNAFSYPLDTSIDNEVAAIQYDGRYFYSLENNTTANSNNGQLLIKRWEIDDYILKHKHTFRLEGISTKKYNCNAFAIEHHETSFSGVVSGTYGSSSIIATDDITRIEAGDRMYMGPSTLDGGLYQECVVASTNPGTHTIYFNTPLTVNFDNGNRIIYSKRCWLFNKYQPNESVGNGQLYSFSLINVPDYPSITSRLIGSQFSNVVASTFMKDSYYSGVGKSFLAYVNTTNILFIEVDASSSRFLETVESAAQNNQEAITSTVIPIYAITHESNTIFRLQHKATYRNGTTYSTEDWATDYNYQLSTLLRLPASISLTAENGVISTGGSTTNINMLVHDQFDQGLGSRPVTVTDDDYANPQATISGSGVLTNSIGAATVVFRSGNTPKTVTVTATVS